MKPTTSLLVLAGCMLAPFTSGAAQQKAAGTYIGVKACVMCHKSEKQGNQLAIWEKSRHSQAYATLTAEKANAIAKQRGSAKPASESPECLACHTVSAPPDANVDIKNGVQCEVCHGPGSDYKSLSVMKDRAKSVAAGLVVYADKGAIERQCRKCHNEKSPTMKEFKFDEMWQKIAHPVPKNP